MTSARMTRILVYEGPAEWIEEMMTRRAVKGTHIVGGSKIIREAIIGDYMETMPENNAGVNSQDFLHLLEDYRHSPLNDKTATRTALEAIKDFIRS